MIRQNTHRLSRMAYVGEYTDRMLLTLKCNTLEQTTDPEKATCHCRTLAPSSVLPFQSSLLGENQPFCWNPNSAGVHSSPVASRLYPPSKHSTILLLKGLPEDQHYQYQLGLYQKFKISGCNPDLLNQNRYFNKISRVYVSPLKFEKQQLIKIDLLQHQLQLLSWAT